MRARPDGNLVLSQILCVDDAALEGVTARFAQNRTLTGYPNDDYL